ncbi:MAG: bifunctional diaminohydroxyphosphoribosylaminopyrimidine deaminase/5-amino-6-(5-phosphoribosylamino)uracil reductase RibD [Pseudomonadota bacterium]
MRDHREYMLEAVALAERASGATSPNPRVGCVLVKDDIIVGTGWHAYPGADHAEVAALKNAGDDARGATAYVTLEPCNHTGRTGPCTEALIKAGVAKVYFGTSDPNPLAAGGSTKLNAAGIPCLGGLCKEETDELVRAWIFSLKHNRPFIVAKSAMGLDGHIATAGGDSKWITGPKARARSHQLRREADAILVGAQTIIADDPTLTARLDGKEWHPLRIVLDPNARTPPGAKVFERTGKGALLVVSDALPPNRTEAHRHLGVDVLAAPIDSAGNFDLSDLLLVLHQRNILMLMIEGGGRTMGSFADADLIDEIWLFYAPVIIGGGQRAFDGQGANSITDAHQFDLKPIEMTGNDFLVRGKRNRGGT